MNKQEFLNSEKKTAIDTLAGHLLVNQSKTALKEIQRGLNRINKVLYSDANKSMPFKDAVAAVEKALFYALD